MPARKMNDDVFNDVCSELQTSIDGLNTLCKKRNSSASAFFDFIDGDKDRTDKYTRARERQAEYLFDIQREVAFKRDEDHTPFTGGNVVQRDRLIMDMLKWQASKLLPRKYGDKIEIDQTVKIEVPLFPDQDNA